MRSSATRLLKTQSDVHFGHFWIADGASAELDAPKSDVSQGRKAMTTFPDFFARTSMGI